jgi:hypothetical protein
MPYRRWERSSTTFPGSDTKNDGRGTCHGPAGHETSPGDEVASPAGIGSSQTRRFGYLRRYRYTLSEYSFRSFVEKDAGKPCGKELASGTWRTGQSLRRKPRRGTERPSGGFGGGQCNTSYESLGQSKDQDCPSWKRLTCSFLLSSAFFFERLQAPSFSWIPLLPSSSTPPLFVFLMAEGRKVPRCLLRRPSSDGTFNFNSLLKTHFPGCS